MQLTDPSQIEVGMIIHRAYKFDDMNGFVESLRVYTTPFAMECSKDALWIAVHNNIESKVSLKTLNLLCNTESLRDAGIQENTYNQHRAFTTYEEALEYVNS